MLADWLILENNEKATLYINLPYFIMQSNTVFFADLDMKNNNIESFQLTSRQFGSLYGLQIVSRQKSGGLVPDIRLISKMISEIPSGTMSSYLRKSNDEMR